MRATISQGPIVCQARCWKPRANIHYNPAKRRLIYAPTIASRLDYGQVVQLVPLIPQLCLLVNPTPHLPMDTVKRASLALRVKFGH